MSGTDVNPYAPPVDVETPQVDERRQALSKLRGPSLGLLFMAVPMGIGGVLLFVVAIALTTVRWVDPNFPTFFSKWEIVQFVGTLPSLFIAYGAWCMRTGKRYQVTLIAAILGSIPFLSPCIWLGIPFGIWALVVLRRPEVRAAFDAQASR
jgi:uncharacterized membrane protein YhaH (DUF805 family)